MKKQGVFLRKISLIKPLGDFLKCPNYPSLNFLRISLKLPKNDFTWTVLDSAKNIKAGIVNKYKEQ